MGSRACRDRRGIHRGAQVKLPMRILLGLLALSPAIRAAEAGRSLAVLEFQSELLQGAQASGGNLDELDRNLTAAVVKLVGPLVNGDSGAGAEPEIQAKVAPAVPASSSPLGFGMDLLAGYSTWSINVTGSGTE